MIFCGLVVAGELDGFVEGEALVAGDDLDRVAVENFMAELAPEAVERAGIGREVEIENPGAGLELDAEEDGAEVECGFPVGGAVGAVAEGMGGKS
jgi:hypothetical protein